MAETTSIEHRTESAATCPGNAGRAEYLSARCDRAHGDLSTTAPPERPAESNPNVQALRDALPKDLEESA